MSEEKDDGLIEIGKTATGYTIYKRRNTVIGGWDYISDSVGCGHIIVNPVVNMDELSIVMNDMVQEHTLAVIKAYNERQKANVQQ